MSDGVLEKLSWEPMHDQVYARLRSALMLARFEPASQISLRAVAKMLDVSVLPVRVAMLRLVAEKALVQAANGSFHVPQLTQAEFDEIVFLRGELEGLAAELAATRRRDADIAALAEIADQLTQAAEANDSDAYGAKNRDFKFAVIGLAQSPVLHDLIESLWVRIGPVMQLYSRNARHQLTIDTHHDVVAAIAAGNGAEAKKAIRQDIMDGAEFLRPLIKFPEGQP
jgi:DNA-binding GntR family transcriptional regulator